MNNRILLVDDEVNLLQSFRRNLRGRYDLVLAEGGEAALGQIANHGPFALVISDMQMPDVDGLRVLAEARKKSPETVRMMLTGNVDQQTAVDAVNDGAIFRFINKPCPIDKLTAILDEGLRQYQLVTAEKELLSKTLAGCVGLINEILALANPKAFGRCGRLRHWMKRLTERLGLEDPWQYEIAAMLSQVGCVRSPEFHQSLNQAEMEAEFERFQRLQASTSSSIVSHIPRLETVAAIIGHQYTFGEAANIPFEVQTGARILRMLIDYDVLVESNTKEQAMRSLRENGVDYLPTALESFSEMLIGRQELRSLPISELVEGMIIEADILTGHGEILIRSGLELTSTMIHRLRSFSQSSIGVREPILMRVSLAPVA